MNIRTKLYIFIPILVILMNLISFFIFESNRKVQESHNLMMDRILLYKQISLETTETLHSLNQILIGLEQEDNPGFMQHLHSLQLLERELTVMVKNEDNDLPIQNYQNMIRTFLEQVEETIEGIRQKKSQVYIPAYNQADKTAKFIREDGQSLVDLELSHYQLVYQEVTRTTERMNKLGASLFVSTTLLSIVFAIWLSHSITDPIRRLVSAANRIARGDLQTKAPELQTGDEIGILCRTFNQMLDNLHDLMAKNMEILEKDRLVKEFELKALQSQINPHFLFNTLNVLSKLAYIEGAEKTSDLAVSVSKLLRYNLQKLDQAVTLRDEVEHAKEYFAIQKARFRDRVSFIMEIDERGLDQAIPCLTLQPILENAFLHGIEGVEEGAVLKLRTEFYDSFIMLEVSDNGVGMAEETRQKLLKMDLDELPRPGKGHSTGLGTKNVFKRLHLFFDGEQSIEIRSKENEGTAVIFKLPHKTVVEYG